jgi:hypothetical protein
VAIDLEGGAATIPAVFDVARVSTLVAESLCQRIAPRSPPARRDRQHDNA